MEGPDLTRDRKTKRPTSSEVGRRSAFQAYPPTQAAASGTLAGS